jgi:GH25 family lysozyme M1 (1,4-beta-N-acetylmuramidase)
MTKTATLLLIMAFYLQANSQTCSVGGCAAADTNSTGHYPTATFSTSSSSWSTVSAYMNGGNWTLFNVTSGDTYEWTYCSDFGGSQGWDAELTLFNNSSGAKLCYSDNCGRSTCSTAPYISWTATFTGKVKLLTTVSGCITNAGSPFSTLVWRDTSGVPNVQVLGLDVSSYQGTINWSQVKAAGFVFAFAKATEGVGYTDTEYANYITNGEAAGVYMGAYHFAHPEDNSARAEANYFLSIAGSHITSCEMPPVLDLENPPSGPSLQSYFTSAQLTAWVQTWMSVVDSVTGISPIIYIGASNAAYLNSSVTKYKLWMDDADGNPSTPPASLGVWNTWAFKQYSWTLTVPGVSGGTDANVFNGDMAALKSLMACSPTTGIEKNNLDRSFVIYPNPASTDFHIDYTGVNGEAVVTVYDINGKLLLNQNMNGKTVIDISNLNDGMYNVNIVNSEGVVNKRLIIAR